MAENSLLQSSVSLHEWLVDLELIFKKVQIIISILFRIAAINEMLMAAQCSPKPRLFEASNFDC